MLVGFRDHEIFKQDLSSICVDTTRRMERLGYVVAFRSSSFKSGRCTSTSGDNKYQLLQMDPRDVLPHMHRAVDR